jgi:hypothetical protein
MTQTTDLDRQLSDWLHDGPNRAPDQPIAAATLFARAHPRRTDPLRFLRSDPMADRRRRAFGLQPGLVFALLALVAAIVAAGVIGSQLENRPVVVPPSDRPAPSSDASPAPSASASPTTSEPPAPFAHVDLASSCCPGNPPSVDVVDLSGLVVLASSALPLESDSADGIVVKNDKANSLRLTWLGSPCDTVHRLTVDATATHIVLERPRCFGDATARYLSLTVTFSRSIVATDVAASIIEGDGAGGSLPNWTVDGPDTAGNVFHVQIFDASGRLNAAESTSQGGGAATLPANTGRVEQAGSDTITLVWARDPCETNERLVIDSGPAILTMVGSGCAGSRALDRELTLTFSAPISAADLDLRLEAQPGPS